MWSSQMQAKEESVVYLCRTANQCATQADRWARHNPDTATLRERAPRCQLVRTKVQPPRLWQTSAHWNRPQTTWKHMEEKHSWCIATSTTAPPENGQIQRWNEIHPRQDKSHCRRLSRVAWKPLKNTKMYHYLKLMELPAPCLLVLPS